MPIKICQSCPHSMSGWAGLHQSQPSEW